MASLKTILPLSFSAAFAVMAPALPARADKVDDWARTCESMKGQEAVNACTWFIDRSAKMEPASKANILFLRGMSYSGLHDYAKALPDFEQSLVHNPDFGVALNARCWIKALPGYDLSSALADCERAVTLLPKEAMVYDTRGFVKFRLGRFAEAIKDFDAALALDPRKAPSLYVRGVAKARTGDAPGSAADIAAAKAVSPGIAEEYAGYGVAAP